MLVAFAYRSLPPALAGAVEALARRTGALKDLPLEPLGPRGRRRPARPPRGRSLPAERRQPVLPAGAPPEHEGVAAAVGARARRAVRARAHVPVRRSPSRATRGAGLAAAAAGLSEDDALHALDELVGILRATDARRYRFRHPIVHRAVYEATGPGWRLAAHARAAGALRDGPPRERAHHLERCAKAGRRGGDRGARRGRRGRRPRGRRALVRRRPSGSSATSALAAGPARPCPRRHRPCSSRRWPSLRDALSLVPGDTRLIAATATCEHLLGRYASAHARVRTLPEHDVALLVDAVYEPDYAALKSRAKRAVAIDPENATAWALLALAHGAHGS